MTVIKLKWQSINHLDHHDISKIGMEVEKIRFDQIQINNGHEEM